MLAVCAANRPSIAPSPAQTASATPNSAFAKATLPTPLPPPFPRPPRTRLDGRAFPDKVLALSWDDGPDASTFELAAYLAKQKISATFFVVDSWVDGVSDDPGSGQNVFRTGYESYPIVGDLVALGHRVGNHTLHHVVLHETAGEMAIDRELRENQRKIDPFITSELRLFRAPGGGWGPFAENVVDRDSYLAELVGPVFWDVDRKDWDASLECMGTRTQCERHGPGTLRTKPSVVAARYLETIERVGHGIVLLHDRVGDVGSTYALTLARALIPELKARGYVFAAPVLHDSPLTLRLERAANVKSTGDAGDAFDMGDIDGDGRADVCELLPSGIECATSVLAPYTSADRLARTIFRRAQTVKGVPRPLGHVYLADVTGDGKADVCVEGGGEIDCAVTSALGAVGTFRCWEILGHARRVFDLADINGDGKADACMRTTAGIECATSTASSFSPWRLWLDIGTLNRVDRVDRLDGAVDRFEDRVAFAMADINGDGKADLCAMSDAAGVQCATSDGKHFGRLHQWSTAGDFSDATSVILHSLRLADLNGDGRADVCAVTSNGLDCALSTGHAFTKATPWLSHDEIAQQGWQLPERAETIRFGDINGDGRADVCGRGQHGQNGIVCGISP